MAVGTRTPSLAGYSNFVESNKAYLACKQKHRKEMFFQKKVEGRVENPSEN